VNPPEVEEVLQEDNVNDELMSDEEEQDAQMDPRLVDEEEEVGEMWVKVHGYGPIAASKRLQQSN